MKVESLSDIFTNPGRSVKYQNVTIGYLTNLYYVNCDANKYEKIYAVLTNSIKNRQAIKIKTVNGGKYVEIVDARE